VAIEVGSGDFGEVEWAKQFKNCTERKREEGRSLGEC
jgi:hypothetical protein